MPDSLSLDTSLSTATRATTWPSWAYFIAGALMVLVSLGLVALGLGLHSLELLLAALVPHGLSAVLLVGRSRAWRNAALVASGFVLLGVAGVAVGTWALMYIIETLLTNLVAVR